MPMYIANDQEFHVQHIKARQSGSQQGFIVFLHGLGSGTRDWQAQIDVFSAGFDCLAIDLRGHGQSARPAGPYSIEEMADDVAQILPQLTNRPAHVVGLSMGAQVAMQLALDQPALVGSLTVINSPASMRPVRLKDKLTVLQRKLLVRLLGMRKVGEVLAQRLLPGDEFASARKTFAARWAENDPAAYRASLNAILQWDVTARLPELEIPMLIVVASDDYTPLQSKQIIADTVPSAQLVVIENSRHAIPLERPDALNGVISKFLKGLGS